MKNLSLVKQSIQSKKKQKTALASHCMQKRMRFKPLRAISKKALRSHSFKCRLEFVETQILHSLVSGCHQNEMAIWMQVKQSQSTSRPGLLKLK